MRKTFIIMGISLALVALGVWFFMWNTDTAAKDAIDKEGTQITQVSVSVAQVDLSHQTGEGRLTNLVIGNPPGFLTPFAFSFSDTTFKLYVHSLATKLYIIHELHVHAPDINIEQNDQHNNMEVIRANIQAFVDTHAVAADAQVTRFIIETLTIQNAKLHVSAPLIQKDLVTIPLPDVHLVNIGRDSGGATSPELVNLIMQQINIQIAQAIKSRGLEYIINVNALAPQPASLTDRIRNLFK